MTDLEIIACELAQEVVDGLSTQTKDVVRTTRCFKDDTQASDARAAFMTLVRKLGLQAEWCFHMKPTRVVVYSMLGTGYLAEVRFAVTS